MKNFQNLEISAYSEDSFSVTYIRIHSLIYLARAFKILRKEN